MEKLTIYTDGGARGNPGPAAVGVVIQDGKGEVLKEWGEYMGETTNNRAEYEGVVRALEEAKKIFGDKLRDMEVEVKMDSELVVRQLMGQYKVKDAGLKEQFARVATLLEDTPHITFTHVRREQNARADELVNEALDAHLQ
jgi:ribonuclease HI